METLIVLVVMAIIGIAIYTATRKKSSKNLPHNSGGNNNANHSNQ